MTYSTTSTPPMGSDPPGKSMDAVRRYEEFIKKQKRKIDEALKGNTQDDCETALKELGKLSHSIQDYYGHGVSEKYGQRISGRRTRKRGGTPRYGIGRMRGSPFNPTMMPSSYHLWGIFGNHGFILSPEPGTRAPDTGDRKKASVNATIQLFEPYLKTWCETCGRCPTGDPVRTKEGNRKWPKNEDYDVSF